MLNMPPIHLTQILQFFWEFPCPLCGNDNPVPHSLNGFCPECLEKLPLIHGKRCPGCGGELTGIFDFCSQCLAMPKRPWEHAMALMYMEGLGEEVIYKLKYRRSTVMARAIAEVAAPLLQLPDFQGIDQIVPVPLHWRRRWERGYNQSELLTKFLAKHLERPSKNALKRVRFTRQQAKLNREERLKNLIGAFTVPHPETVKDQTILLVDDVLTTGATLHAAAQALLEAGAKEVLVFAAARRR